MSSKDKKMEAQIKKIRKVFERAQKENALEKKKKISELKKLTSGTADYQKLKDEIDSIKTISDGTKKTYLSTSIKILKEVNEEFGIKEWKSIKPEHIEKIIDKRIDAGQSPQTIKKAVHSINFVDEHAVKTRVFKENQNINLTNHEDNLALLKKRGVVRRSDDSKRFKATYSDAEAVVKEMEKYDSYYAQIARYQLLTGFRINDTVKQKAENIKDEKHVCFKSKGGLTNIVHTNHHTSDDKDFLDELIRNRDAETGRIFERQKDEFGNYRSDNSISIGVTQLAAKCASKLGIVGENGETFSSHSFRGAFAHNRMLYYVEHHHRLDDLIEEKIIEQPRLKQRYQQFESHIKNKIKPENRHSRKILDFEKIQWLISTDLNHSRQDVVRYYIPNELIKEELAKLKK